LDTIKVIQTRRRCIALSPPRGGRVASARHD